MHTANSIDSIKDVITLLKQVVHSPVLPQEISLTGPETTEFLSFYKDLTDLRTFIKKLGEGDLSARLPMKGYLAGILKAQQANLRHMTWQAEKIAEGDFDQRLDFLGDFSAAFNKMTLQLKESMQIIKAKEAELKRTNLELQEEIKKHERVQQLLAEKEAHYRRLTETMQDVLWIIDSKTMETTFVSPSILSLSGYTSEEILNIPISKLVTEQTTEEIVKTISEYKNQYAQNPCVQKNFHYTFESVLLRKDGTTTWTEIIINFIWDQQAKDIFINAVIRDISKRKKIQDDLKYQATTDVLTNIPNRRCFFASAETKIRESKISDAPLCFLVLDIDYFKNINDNFGHMTGDLFLQKVASICEKTLRSTDMIGRVGGEEFAIFMPDTTLAYGIKVAERIRTTIENEIFETYCKKIVPITVSIGITQTNMEDSLTTVMARADKALYLAKNQGRNQACSI